MCKIYFKKMWIKAVNSAINSVQLPTIYSHSYIQNLTEDIHSNVQFQSNISMEETRSVVGVEHKTLNRDSHCA